MANYKLQEMNDLRNTGRRTVYPKVVTNRTMDTNDIVEKMKGYNLGIAPSTTKGYWRTSPIFLSPCFRWATT